MSRMKGQSPNLRVGCAVAGYDQSNQRLSVRYGASAVIDNCHGGQRGSPVFNAQYAAISIDGVKISDLNRQAEDIVGAQGAAGNRKRIEICLGGIVCKSWYLP